MSAHELTFRRIVRSELTKMFSVLSSWLVLIVVPVAFVGLAAIIGSNSRNRVLAAGDVVGGGFLLFAMAFGVFGVLTMSGEFGSGTIRATLIAVPRRLPVLWAKAVVVFAVTTPVLIATYFGIFFAHQAFAVHPLTLADPDVLRSIFGAAGASVGCVLIGLGVGTILRYTAGAITVYIGVLILLPQILLGLLPPSAQISAIPFLPTMALQALYNTDPSKPMFAPGLGGLVVIGWVILVLGGAAMTLRRRDA